MKTIGSRAEVFHGTAKKTSGGLLKKNLKKNKRGRIVSKKMSNRAKKDKRLVKAGYKTKKGKFTLFPKKKKGGSQGLIKLIVKNVLEGKLEINDINQELLKSFKTTIGAEAARKYFHTEINKYSDEDNEDKRELGSQLKEFIDNFYDISTSKPEPKPNSKPSTPPKPPTPPTPPPETIKLNNISANSKWWCDDEDLKNISKKYNVIFMVYEEDRKTWSLINAFELSNKLASSPIIFLYYPKANNHYEYLGFSTSCDKANKVKTSKNDPNIYGECVLTAINKIEYTADMALGNIGRTLPRTVGDGWCGWYAVQIGLANLKIHGFNISSVRSTDGRLFYNQKATKSFIKTIREMRSKKGGRKIIKRKIYTGSRGGRYYKRKGKKIYI